MSGEEMSGTIWIAVTVKLRPYQESCLQACRNALQAGATRIGVSLPTGAGKTTVFISLLAQISPPSHSPSTSRALIIVNSIELARQAAAQAAAQFPQWRVEIEQGVKHKASGNADVTVATYQTLLQPQRLAKFHPGNLKAVIVDEAHHAAAPSYRRILAHFDPAIRSPDATFQPPQLSRPIPIIGFSATFSRHDGLALGSVFQQIVYHRDFLEMIKEQWLCDVRFTSVKANIDLRNVTVNSKTGDFNATSLAHIINTDTVNNLVVQAWLDRARQRRSTLVFCVNIAHIRALTKTFKDFGVDVHYLHSGTPASERHTLITAFKAGKYPVLVNCAILTEGADIPNIDCIIVARPTRSRNVFAQMIGRGMRQSPSTGKVNCRIIDFVDSTNRVAGVVSTPTLFGLDPEELIDDESVETLEARAQIAVIQDAGDEQVPVDSRDDIPDPKYITYVDYQNPFALVDGCSGAPHITKLSTNAWVGCGEDVYILECLGKGYIRIECVSADEESPAHYRATFTEATMHMPSAKAFKVSPFMRKRLIMTAETLSDAIRGCDTYAAQKVLRGSLALGLLRTAKWRKTSASDSQKNFIQKRRVKRALDQDTAAATLQNITKGEAANIITRLKHGAKAYYEKKAREAKKASQLAEKERRRKEREIVQVGPLVDHEAR
ncbi:P-loop containing nucleoside triphosphate hydrolase protein [Suillus subalutaceus]|uniref:P-loop containing nucleoside triphosphate hydrolase protein n=1 Tax=Suillus subalutaceus TaxID=48586 RepID=UPI001B870EB2|nr:P-loop containing nucleoside triphosphate hydrolase protein [Suillus subalutaceus]KAG1864258.1 P-loop containing nucleoside triphosphate hydrolase protein [Suillus subalutaceus]